MSLDFIPAQVLADEPMELAADLPPETLELKELAARAEQPIRVELRIDRDGEDLRIDGWATTTLSLVCGRCAVWFPWPVRARVEHLLEAPHPNSIDLTPLIREDTLLELPLNAACRLGANGRCPVTGEIHQPRPESTESLAGEAVWEPLSRIKPKK